MNVVCAGFALLAALLSGSALASGPTLYTVEIRGSEISGQLLAIDDGKATPFSSTTTSERAAACVTTDIGSETVVKPLEVGVKGSVSIERIDHTNISVAFSLISSVMGDSQALATPCGEITLSSVNVRSLDQRLRLPVDGGTLDVDMDGEPVRLIVTAMQ